MILLHIISIPLRHIKLNQMRSCSDEQKYSLVCSGPVGLAINYTIRVFPVPQKREILLVISSNVP